MKNIAKNGAVVAEIGGFEFKGAAKVGRDGSESRGIGTKALYEKYYSKASKEVIDERFSLFTVIESAPQWR